MDELTLGEAETVGVGMTDGEECDEPTSGDAVPQVIRPEIVRNPMTK